MEFSPIYLNQCLDHVDVIICLQNRRSLAYSGLVCLKWILVLSKYGMYAIVQCNFCAIKPEDLIYKVNIYL